MMASLTRRDQLVRARSKSLIRSQDPVDPAGRVGEQRVARDAAAERREEQRLAKALERAHRYVLAGDARAVELGWPAVQHDRRERAEFLAHRVLTRPRDQHAGPVGERERGHAPAAQGALQLVAQREVVALAPAEASVSQTRVRIW